MNVQCFVFFWLVSNWWKPIEKFELNKLGSFVDFLV